MQWIEVRFAIAYMYSGNRAAAAKDVGIRREYTYNTGRKDGDDFEGRVDQLIELMKTAAVQSAMQLIQLATVKAAGVLIHSLDNTNTRTRMAAAKILLEYGIGKPVARTLTEGKVQHEHQISKLYAVDPGWPGLTVEHITPENNEWSTDEVASKDAVASEDEDSFNNEVAPFGEFVDGEATYPIDDE